MKKILLLGFSLLLMLPLAIGQSGTVRGNVFDKDTGEVLWEHELPFDGHSTPSTYAVNAKQYVVISAGGTKEPCGPLRIGSI